MQQAEQDGQHSEARADHDDNRAQPTPVDHFAAADVPIATTRRRRQRRIATATTAPPTATVILIGSQPCGRYPMSDEVIQIGPPPGCPVSSTNRSPLLHACIGRANATMMAPAAMAPATH